MEKQERIVPPPRKGCKLINATLDVPFLVQAGLLPTTYALLEIAEDKSLLDYKRPFTGEREVIVCNLVTPDGQRNECYIPVDKLLYAYDEPRIRLATAAELVPPPVGGQG